MMEPRQRRQLIAYVVALSCYVVAIALRLTKDDNWLVPHWIFLSVGFVAFMAGGTLFRRRQS